MMQMVRTSEYLPTASKPRLDAWLRMIAARTVPRRLPKPPAVTTRKAIVMISSPMLG